MRIASEKARMAMPRHERVRGLEFRQIDPARRRARRYHLSECRSLFGERAILIVWGRIGRPARARLETFETDAKLRRRWNELLARRKAHGYQLHGSSSPQDTRRPLANKDRAA